MKEITHWKMQEDENLLCWNSQNGEGYFCGICIYKKEKVVGILVDDNYYDFNISFDKFLEIAEKVKEVKEQNDTIHKLI